MEYKSELQLQSDIWKWFYNKYPEYRIEKVGKQPRCLLVHNLLNAKSVVEASKLSSAGLTKGLPDLTLYVPRNGYNGLFMEIKLEDGGRPRKDQDTCMKSLSNQGYYCGCVNSLEDAKDMIKCYLEEGIDHLSSCIRKNMDVHILKGCSDFDLVIYFKDQIITNGDIILPRLNYKEWLLSIIYKKDLII